MLLGQSKKIRDSLDAILLRIGHVEQSVDAIRDSTRQMHHDMSDKQNAAQQTLHEIKERVAPAKKSKPSRKPKDVSV